MKKQYFQNAYIALLSGVAKIVPDKGIETKFNCDIIYISFPDFPNSNKVIVKSYYKNGNKNSHFEYLNSKLHGRCAEWHRNGNIKVKQEYSNGQLHGTSVWYCENQNLLWKDEYLNGKLILS